MTTTPKPHRVRVQLDHHSSKWNRSRASLVAGLKASLDDGSSIVTVTEIDLDRRGAHLDDALPGTQVCRGKAGDTGEVAIIVNTGVWQVVEYGVHVVGADTGPGVRVIAVVAALMHRATGHRLIVATSHLPSAVEGAYRVRDLGGRLTATPLGRRAVEHQRAVRRTREHVREAYARYHADAWVFTSDWNLNVRRRWVRAWVRAVWPGCQLPAHLPAEGSHGDRLIDWPIGRGWFPTLSLRVLDKTPASDHRPIRVAGHIG